MIKRNPIQVILIISILSVISLLFISGRASCVGGSKSKAKTGSSDIPVFTINAPSNLSATAVSFNQIDLTWQNNASNADGFELERSTDGITYTLISTLNANATFYSDTTVVGNVTYYYRIRAFNNIGDYSDYSNVVSAFTFDWNWMPISWTATATRGWHVIALANNNTIWGWGLNNYFQLGLGDVNNRYAPVPIGIDSDWVIVAAGGGSSGSPGHSLGIKTNGTLWAWGYNQFGQLGLGDYLDSAFPYPVGTESDWSIVTAGMRHVIAIKTNRTIWSWGGNGEGQLGLGYITDWDSGVFTPSQIGTTSDWSLVRGGFTHTLAIKTNGGLWAWGQQYTIIPNQIGTDTDWSNVAVGWYHSIGIKTNATLWGWGYNDTGQLGTGDTDNPYTNTPTQIGTDSDWSSIGAGCEHTMAIKTNGIIWAWGGNGSGQLGLGDRDIRLTPTQVGTDSNWSIVEGGQYDTIALKEDGSIWTCGNNEFGRLGLGDTINRTLFYRIGTPSPPVSLIVTVISSSEITLSWVDISTNANGFVIERKNGITGTWETLATVGVGVTSYSDTTVSSGNVYYYRIRSYNNFGYSPYSEDVTPNILSPSPLTLTVVSSSEIRLLWMDNSPDETVFQIERKIGLTGTWSTTFTVGANVTTYSDTTVSPGNLYYYHIRASNAFADSVWSNEADPVLSTPSLLILTVISSTQIDLSWTDNSPDEAGFKIERKIGTGGSYAQIGTTLTDVVTYPDTTVSPGNIYYYRVKAYNAFIESSYSNEVTPALSAPSPLTLTVISSAEIRVSWTDNSSYETGFKIERKTNRIGTYEQIATPTANTIFYSDTTVTTGNTYYYRIRAYNPFCDSEYAEAYTAVSGNWSVIVAGYYHTLALKTNGTIWVWGQNYTNTPNQIGTNTDWQGIAADGLNSNIALKTNGTIWSGNSTLTQVGTDSDWLTASRGYNHTIAIKTNRSIWTWGNNSYYQLGLGDMTNRSTPAQIENTSDWSALRQGDATLLP